MLTQTTTREEYLEELLAALRSTPSNSAIEAHAKKVEAMDDERWEAHKARLLGNEPQIKAAARRMREEVEAKGFRFR